MVAIPYGIVQVFICEPHLGRIIEIPCIGTEIELSCSFDGLPKGRVVLEIVGNIRVHYEGVHVEVTAPLLEKENYEEASWQEVDSDRNLLSQGSESD